MGFPGNIFKGVENVVNDVFKGGNRAFNQVADPIQNALGINDEMLGLLIAAPFLFGAPAALGGAGFGSGGLAGPGFGFGGGGALEGLLGASSIPLGDAAGLSATTLGSEAGLFAAPLAQGSVMSLAPSAVELAALSGEAPAGGFMSGLGEVGGNAWNWMGENPLQTAAIGFGGLNSYSQYQQQLQQQALLHQQLSKDEAELDRRRKLFARIQRGGGIE